MILTCPECATSYFVDDSRIPNAGRSVKCTNCGARWTVTKEAPPPEVPPPPPAPAPRLAEAFVADTSDDLEVVIAEAPIVAPARRSSGPKAQARGKVVVWVAAAVVVAALIAGALVFRGKVVRLWPASQAAYAGIGLPVNSLGLVIEQVRVESAFQGGRPVFAVSGAIRNVGDAAVTAPALRISLLDRAGKPVAAKIIRPLDGRVPAGARRHFAIAMLDPPARAHDLEVTFDAGAKAAPPPPARVATPPPVAAGPEPVEAQPLPPGSPDALPTHD